MSDPARFHSICRWTFHAGKGGFLPANQRPEWAADRFDTVAFVRLVASKIRPRLPENIHLGVELHYDFECDEKNAEAVASALLESGISLAMLSPGAHVHHAYGGVCSLDPNERAAAEAFGERSVDLAYGPLRKAWHQDPEMAPTLVLWNGSFGYDLASIGVRDMYGNLKKSLAKLCRYEEKRGGQLFIGLEPKPNEGHPAMLLPTVASALVLWNRVHEEFGISRDRKGVNKEIGHSEMVGLDQVHDTWEELDNNAMVHTHLNSQGYNDGIILGGPGKFDIDHGCRINGMNLAIARLMQDSGYRRWKGHDMQVRPYDDTEQGVDRVIRSVLSWEACERAAAQMDAHALLQALKSRATARAEDIIRASVSEAFRQFDQLYGQ